MLCAPEEFLENYKSSVKVPDFRRQYSDLISKAGPLEMRPWRHIPLKNVSINGARYYAGLYVLHSSNVWNTAMQAVCENPRKSVLFRKLVSHNNVTEFLFLWKYLV